MFGKKSLISLLLLCMALLLIACTDNSKQSNAGQSSSKKQTNGNKADSESVKNTYWICEQEDGEWKRTVELIFNEDGSFHCRSVIGEGSNPFCVHVDADSYTWVQNSDMVELEFKTKKPDKKEIFYAHILNKGDKIRCSDMFEVTEDSLTFIKQDKVPKFTSIEEDSQKLIGEWELVSVGIYSPKYIDSDSGSACESDLNIYQKKDKMYADYNIVREKGSGKSNIEQIGISLDNKPLNSTCLNEFWSASFDDPVIPDDVDTKEKFNVKFALVDDNKLVLIEDKPGDEYTDYPELVYLRKDSKEYDDKENYFYTDTVTVSNINELVKNLKSNTKIILKEGEYNFSDIYGKTDEYYDAYDYGQSPSNCLLYINHIKLEAETGSKVSILTDSPSDNVLEIYGGNDISIQGLILGHNVEKGSCTGNVLSLSSCDGVSIEDCNLFGCGAYGISSDGASHVKISNTQIYECTYGLLDFNNTYNSSFKDCVFRDSECFDQFIMNYCNNIKFENCKINDNKVMYDDYIFISSTDPNDIVFKNCNFKDNIYKTKNSGDIEFTDCTFDDKLD